MKKTTARAGRKPRQVEQAPASLERLSERRGTRQRARSTTRQTSDVAFPIVGVGASAGGLEAFSELLHTIGAPDGGMALVLVQHLDPKHTSFLREALVKTTSDAGPAGRGWDARGAPPRLRHPAEHVPRHPGRQAHAGAAAGRPEGPVPADRLLLPRARRWSEGAARSASSSRGPRRTAPTGCRAIKEANGITFAQEPSSAKFGGMPRSALEAGVVDYCLPIPELAQELVRIGQHPYVVAPDSTPSGSRRGGAAEDLRAGPWHRAGRLQRIQVTDLRAAPRAPHGAAQSGDDRAPTCSFSRSRRRRSGRSTRTPSSTSRRSSATRRSSKSLKTDVFPAIVKSKPEGAAIRVWVPGCATGEEVYSLGIALVEFLGESSRPIQIFGSDLSSKAIETARGGLYPETALRDVSEERRRRYFTKVDRGYRIGKTIRDLCVFVQHDLARDPPFSKVDLVSCRNVLIYFDQALQKRVVPTLPLRAQRARVPPPRPRGEHLGVHAALPAVRPGEQDLRADRGAQHAPVRATLRGAPRAGPGPRVRAARGRGEPAAARPVEAARSTAARPLRAARGRGQREDGGPPVPRGDGGVPAARAGRAAEQRRCRWRATGCPLTLRATLRGGEEDRRPRQGGGRRGRPGRIEADVRRRRHPAGERRPTTTEPLYVVLFEEPEPASARREKRDAKPVAADGAREAAPAEARARARGDQGVPADRHRRARPHQRGPGDGQRGARIRKRRAPEHERGARDGQGGAPVDQRGAHDRQRRAPEPQPRGDPGQQRSREPADDGRHPDPHPRQPAAHPPLHAEGAAHPERPAGRRRSPVRGHQDEHRRVRSRSPDRRGHRDDDREGVGGPGPRRPLVSTADPPLQDHREPHRRRHPVALRHRRAQASHQGGRAGERGRRAGQSDQGRVSRDAVARAAHAALEHADARAAPPSRQTRTKRR